jgi:hypothetical protein
MAAIIYDPLKFHKKMEKMYRAGGMADMAARQAWELIRDLAGKDSLSARLRGLLTQHGDARIKNCYKFDLCGAYRLVYVWQEGCFVFLFLGSHDETDMWIRNNTGMTPDTDRGEVVPPAAGVHEQEPEEIHEPEVGPGPAGLHDLDVPLDEILDQKTLREIFCGISGHPG